ncbi:hypothetical protein CERZMDRAFT_46823 [Cercospora zeae-maydis SCOH1-5]|uniref:Uncharacterized protein n=1 Tax=Cercospora zeae-maydis SCOH1-5 TaxID=717836 RepID=A0A6A6F7P9_9PEZI|nr:hypothetical protein CERZMDRAFT_46823 [Cercospora zeae-maydis SCOH1-5]
MAEHQHERTLRESALDCDDAGSGLYRLRDALSRYATRITAVISELFGLSSALREIHSAEHTHIHGPSFYRITDDLGLLRRSLRYTTQDLFDMFARSRLHTEQRAWEDLEYRMDQQERIGLLERLELYRDFLDAQNDVLEGAGPPALSHFRREVTRLLATQQRLRSTSGIETSGAVSFYVTPLPLGRRLSRPTTVPMPVSPTLVSEDLNWPRPSGLHAPEPPPAVSPTSPVVSPIFSTFSSGSSQTMSSQTSYSSNPYFPAQSATTVHWAQTVFDGSCPTNRYKNEYQSLDRSKCTGDLALDALEALATTGFHQALQLSFDEDRLWVRLYCRPSDSCAIILIMTRDAFGQPLHYTELLTKLKIIREGSLLKLCRVRHGSQKHTMWARLNFFLHERMVLFYSTFVAMKHQDHNGIPHRILLEDLPLINCSSRSGSGGEKLLFAGEIRHGDMRHALHILRDSASKVVRIEASALRGRRKGVPIWTAFVTKYAYDPDWAQLEAVSGSGGGLVSLISLKPEPAVFVAGYAPPINSRGETVLPFATRDGEFYIVLFGEWVWFLLCA